MKKNGFSLIELVVVIAITLVLLGVASLSIKKAIERNDYQKIATIIPKIIFTETNKAFEEGEAEDIELNMSSKYIKVGTTETQLPENYSYTLYSVTRTDDDELGESSNGEETKIIGSDESIFKIEEYGTLTSATVDSTSYSGFYSKYHPSILVQKNGFPFCRVDIISSLYIIPRVIIYRPISGTTSSSADMKDESKWTEDTAN
jgi:prepilin-type N-terminal cleavage/methylation domain-containing protein